MDRLPFRWNRVATRTRDFARLIGVAMLCIAVQSFADRQPGSLTTIKNNVASGNTEIIHRLHNHDAELGIMTVLNDRTMTLDRLVGQAQLALYVEERFNIATVTGDGIGAPMDLELVGAEPDGEFVLVYQELKGLLPAQIAIRDDILRDVFPEQVNQVNIAAGGEVRSLTFRGEDRWQVASID
jgi:hypothetical protein